MFSGTPKDVITNVCAFFAVIAGAVNAYIQSSTDGGINYFQLLGAVALAVIGYFTGKTGAGAPKVG